MKRRLFFTLTLSLTAFACSDSVSKAPSLMNAFAEIHFDASHLIKDEGVTANSTRPAGVANVAGKLFVALGNLTPDCMRPAGPGYLAIIDLPLGEASDKSAYRLVELPSECRNPQNLLAWDGAGALDGNVSPRVFVACAGQYGYGVTPSEALIAVEADSEKVLFTVTFPESASGSAMTPGKMAMLNSRLLVGDGSAGRLFAVDAQSGVIDANHPKGISLCDPHPTQFLQMTGDVLVTENGVFTTCFATSELIHLDLDLNLLSSQSVGSGAQLLARHGEELLVGDTLDNALYAFDLTQSPLAKVSGSDRLGMAANQLLVESDRAYAITSTDNTIQVIDLGPVHAGDFSTGRIIDQIPTVSSTSADATNTNPYLGAIVEGQLYVTLMGACSVDGDVAGNRLIRIELEEGE